MRGIGAWATVFVTVLGLGQARASDLIGPGSSAIPDPSHKVFVLSQVGRKQLVIESWRTTRPAPRIAWLKPIPPDTKVEVSSFDWKILERSAEVLPPYNEQLRQDLFGPSIVTLLSARLGISKPPPDPPETEQTLPLDLEDSRIFEGMVSSSTITGELILPEAMADWLKGRGFEPENSTKLSLSAHLNRGWSIAVSVWSDPNFGKPGAREAGPLAFRIRGQSPVLPLLHRAAGPKLAGDFDLWLAGPQTLVPSTYDTVWREEPWRDDRPTLQAFTALYADHIHNDALREELELAVGSPLPPETMLVAGKLSRGQEAWADIGFHTPKAAVTIPGGVLRGSWVDLLLCLLLGLTPLLYTPESWFLLWLGARAKERRRRGELKAAGHKLWSVFAVVVGVYWLVTLDGPARLAALVPFAIGAVQLVLPYTEREQPRVRAILKKKSPS